MPTEDKPKCPDCETELVLVDGKLPEKCAKCGFYLKGFPAFTRWFGVAAKQFEKGTKKKTAPADDDSPLAALGSMFGGE